YAPAPTAPNDPTVASSSAGGRPPLPPTMYGPQPYGAAPPIPYGTPPPSPYEPYSSLPPPPPPSPPRRGNRIWLLAGIALLVFILIGSSIIALLSLGGKLAPSPATPTV